MTKEYKLIWKEGTLFSRGKWELIPVRVPGNGMELIIGLVFLLLAVVVLGILILCLPFLIMLIGFMMVREKRYYAGIVGVIAFIYFLMDIQNGWISSYLFFGYLGDNGVFKEGFIDTTHFTKIYVINFIGIFFNLGYIIDGVVISQFGQKFNNEKISLYQQVLAYSLPIIAVGPLFMYYLNYAGADNDIKEQDDYVQEQYKLTTNDIISNDDENNKPNLEVSYEMVNKSEENNSNIPTSKEVNKEGEIEYHNKNFEKAIQLFQQAIKLDSGNAQAYSNLAISFQKTGKYTEAIWANKKAIEVAKGGSAKIVRANSYYNIARIYEKKGQWREALNSFKRAKSLRKNSADVQGIQRMQEHLGL